MPHFGCHPPRGPTLPAVLRSPRCTMLSRGLRRHESTVHVGINPSLFPSGCRRPEAWTLHRTKTYYTRTRPILPRASARTTSCTSLDWLQAGATPSSFFTAVGPILARLPHGVKLHALGDGTLAAPHPPPHNLLGWFMLLRSEYGVVVNSTSQQVRFLVSEHRLLKHHGSADQSFVWVIQRITLVQRLSVLSNRARHALLLLRPAPGLVRPGDRPRSPPDGVPAPAIR